jgi:hypothetical protein
VEDAMPDNDKENYFSNEFSSTKKEENENIVVLQGKVGINTNQPDEALTVVGNLKLSGVLLQPSDMRIKQNISQVVKAPC